MSWQVLISINILLYSVVVLLQRTILKEKEIQPIAYTIFFGLLTGFFVAVAGFIFADMRLPNLRPLVFNLLLTTLFYGFGNLFIYKSLKLTEASKFTIIFTSRSFFTVVSASLFLREFLTVGQLIGAVLIFLAVVLVNLKKMRFSLRAGELFGFLAAVGYGFAATNDRFLFQFLPVFPYLSLAFIVPAMILSLIFRAELRDIKFFLKSRVLAKIVLISLLYTLGASAFYGALQMGENVSQIASINMVSVITTVVLAAIFLKERGNLAKKILAAGLSFFGALLLR